MTLQLKMKQTMGGLLAINILLCICAFPKSLAIEDIKRIKPPKITADIIASESVAVAEYQRTDVLPEIDIRRASRFAVSGKISSTSMEKFGYPYNTAPTLPPFLQSRADDSPDEYHSKRISYSKPDLRRTTNYKAKPDSSYGKRKKVYEDNAEETVAYQSYSPTDRYQSYREPQYRNFDDLDSAYRPRPVEYRGYSQVYGPAPDTHYHQQDPYASSRHPAPYYAKTKPSATAKRSKKYGVSRYSTPVNYEDPYNRYDIEPSQGYGYRDSNYDKDHYTRNYSPYEGYTKQDDSYESEYSHPHPSPIVGEIRKRLLDYAGASDLFNGEPDYLKEAAARKRKFNIAQRDYYPFRRIDLYSDLEINESKHPTISAKQNSQ